jgi:hypothetical protein
MLSASPDRAGPAATASVVSSTCDDGIVPRRKNHADGWDIHPVLQHALGRPTFMNDVPGARIIKSNAFCAARPWGETIASMSDNAAGGKKNQRTVFDADRFARCHSQGGSA